MTDTVMAAHHAVLHPTCSGVKRSVSGRRENAHTHHHGLVGIPRSQIMDDRGASRNGPGAYRCPRHSIAPKRSEMDDLHGGRRFCGDQQDSGWDTD